MREIKFRGFSESESKWVYGNLIEKDGAYYILEKTVGLYSNAKRKNNIYDGLGGRFRFELHKVEKESVGQYTGHKDKNGKEIYRGDIIKNKYYPWGVNQKIKQYYKIGVVLDYAFISWELNCLDVLDKSKIDKYLYPYKRRHSQPEYIDKDLLHKDIYRFNAVEVIGNVSENPELLETK